MLNVMIIFSINIFPVFILCVKSVQIRNFFWSVFSRIRTEYGPGKTPYLDTFHVVIAYIIFIGKNGNP